MPSIRFSSNSEKWNFNWSCAAHPSPWSGTMYWCCGRTSINHIGCVRNKHIPEQLEEGPVAIASDHTLKFCSSCREVGHHPHRCPQDPNTRSNTNPQEELKRLQTIKFSRSRKRSWLKLGARRGVTEMEAWDDLTTLKRDATLQSLDSIMEELPDNT